MRETNCILLLGLHICLASWPLLPLLLEGLRRPTHSLGPLRLRSGRLLRGGGRSLGGQLHREEEGGERRTERPRLFRGEGQGLEVRRDKELLHDEQVIF